MSIESGRPVEATQFEFTPRYDSGEVKDVIKTESQPSLGEYAKLREIKDWLNTSAENRFSESSVERAITNFRDSIDEDKLQLEDNVVQRSRLSLCNVMSRDFTENPQGMTRTLLENLKVHGLARALTDEAMKDHLEKTDYASEEIDYVVASAVIGSFFEVVNYNQSDEPMHTFSQN